MTMSYLLVQPAIQLTIIQFKPRLLVITMGNGLTRSLSPVEQEKECTPVGFCSCPDIASSYFENSFVSFVSLVEPASADLYNAENSYSTKEAEEICYTDYLESTQNIIVFSNVFISRSWTR
ncbi:hypothetical protein EDC96DRAFT_542861 [Choanephora cucurbitarum]|nr:hypothetical protein EDC96DRAFT_542861 [Choanephora cucurbitarum]